jgi:hypothetical protein
MWSGRTIVALAVLAAGCAVPRAPGDSFERRVAAVLERRALGSDALLVIDNLLRHGPPPPPAACGLALELLARPLAAAYAAEVFRRSVPAALTQFRRDAGRAQGSFDDLLKTYLAELAEAQRMLRSGSKAFDEDTLLRQLAQGRPSAEELLRRG